MHRIESVSNDTQRRLHCGAWLLGFALSGFLDGILLHQVLQWHHLLSGLEQARLSLSAQILADGVFHAAMYLIALAGLWLLFATQPARAALAATGARRRLLAWALIGFGLWHVADALLSHWLLGIHRIRMDAASPLLWDLVWVVVFGLVPLAWGWRLKAGTGSGTGAGTAVALALAAGATAWIAAAGMPGGAGSRTLAVVLRADVPPSRLLAALPAAGARVVWGDGQVWFLALEERANPWQLYRHGALWVGGGVLPVGCSAWLRR